MKLSIIVPMRNEALVLPLLLKQLGTLKSKDTEIILVDGKSTDNSVLLAKTAGFSVYESSPGRAKQMNLGAAKSRGNILLFLHADTKLPNEAKKNILDAIEKGALWGRFDVRISGKHAFFPMVAYLMNTRSRLSSIATGDQAIFISRAVFEKCGGFPDQPLMEDIEICKRLKKIARPASLFAKVTTSGRRFEKYGLWRTILLMWKLRWQYWRGVPAKTLAIAYH